MGGGRLTTHVLDTAAGIPAAGVAVALLRYHDRGGASTIARARTNADGRTDAPLLAGTLPCGRYELAFEIGPYFAAQGRTELPDPPFLDRVALAFGIANPDGHYHVPLLVSPWSYATYRGS